MNETLVNLLQENRANNLAESSNDESRDGEKDDGTIGKTCEIPRTELSGFSAIHAMNISARSAVAKELFPKAMILFVMFASNHKY